MTHILSWCLYVITIYILIYKVIKKIKAGVLFIKNKKIVILIVTSCLILGGLSPTINSFLIKNNNETYKHNYNQTDPDYKETNYDDDVIAVASFHWNPKYPDPGEKVTFYSDSYAYNGYITSEKWEFDTGHVDHGHKTAYTFEKKGSYKVTLRVKAYGISGGLDWDSRTTTVKIGADPFPKIICTPEDPSPGEKVTLDASKSNDPDGKIISYKWSYYNVNNPGNVTELGSDITIYYTWEKQGIYNVSLFVEDDKGNNNTIEKEIHVSILKITGFNTFSRGIHFKISNHGDITAKNIKWNLKVDKYRFLGIVPRRLYRKSGTIETLNPEISRDIKIKRLRRAFCKIKLVLTVEADNAVKISKTYYGRVIGKFIYLREYDIARPLFDAFKFMIFFGIGLTILSFIIWILFDFLFIAALKIGKTSVFERIPISIR